jgi:hypothetical protein
MIARLTYKVANYVWGYDITTVIMIYFYQLVYGWGRKNSCT